MKKILALALMLLLSLTASAEETDIILPLMDTLLTATQAGAGVSEDQTMIEFLYTNATEDDLNYFLLLASSNGVYPYELDMEEGSSLIGYYLLLPGSDALNILYYDPAAEQLYIAADINVYGLNEEGVATRIAFFTQEIRLPSGAGSNAFPNFPYVVSQEPYFTGTMENVSYAFDNQKCWTEMYDQIDGSDLRSYVNYMMLFGFDVWLDIVDMEEDGRINPVLLHLSNGDAEVLLLYDALEQTATLYYEPGVSYYLLSGAELEEALAE